MNRDTLDSMGQRASKVTEETPAPEPLVFLDSLVTRERRVRGAIRDTPAPMASPALLEIKAYPETMGFPAHEVGTALLEDLDSQESRDEMGSQGYLERKEKSETKVNQVLMDFLESLDTPDFPDSKETKAMPEGQDFLAIPVDQEPLEIVAM